MPTSYTSLLGLALPVTGELSGTWGDTVNDYITQYLDAAVAGAQTISGSQTAVTLSKTTASSLTQAGSGATGSSQYQIINCTGNPASLLTITAPAASKAYLVLNNTSTSQSVKVVGAGPTTGVTMVSGENALIAWNGSDFVKVASSVADGVTTFSAGTTGFTPSTATSGAVTLGGTLATTNGGTGLTSFTANGVVYASSSSALTTGSALTFDGTKLTNTGSAGGVRLEIVSTGSSPEVSITSADTGTSQINFGGVTTPKKGVFRYSDNSDLFVWLLNSTSEQMRLTSTGLKIGTTSDFASAKLVTNGGGIGILNKGLLRSSTDGVLQVSADPNNAYASSQISFDIDGSTVATLDSSGNLSLATNGTSFQWTNSGNNVAINGDSGVLAFYTGTSSYTERARITSTGTFQLSSNYQEGVVTANTGTAYTISLASGTVQILTLTGNCTFTFPTATSGQSFILLLKQDGTGSRTVTWPAAVKWPGSTAPTITSTASRLDKYIFTADGTNWYGSNAGQNYTV